MGEEVSVYYCTDDHGSLPGVNERDVRAMDEETTRRASLVFVTSETLLESKRSLNPNVFVSPHGVHVEHFGQAQDESLPVPEEMRGLRQPIVGFFAMIGPWIDLDLIGYLGRTASELVIRIDRSIGMPC